MTTEELNEKIERMENSILLNIPQLPIVQDHVGKAMKLAKDNKSAEDYFNSLKLASSLIPYAKQNDNDCFFKYHIMTISILWGIEGITDTKEFKSLDTISDDVRKGIELINSLNIYNYKDLSALLVKALNENLDVFCIKVQQMINEVKEAKACDPILAGYGFTILSLKLSNIEVPPVVAMIYNELQSVISASEF